MSVGTPVCKTHTRLAKSEDLTVGAYRAVANYPANICRPQEDHHLLWIYAILR